MEDSLNLIEPWSPNRGRLKSAVYAELGLLYIVRRLSWSICSTVEICVTAWYCEKSL